MSKRFEGCATGRDYTLGDGRFVSVLKADDGAGFRVSWRKLLETKGDYSFYDEESIDLLPDEAEAISGLLQRFMSGELP